MRLIALLSLVASAALAQAAPSNPVSAEQARNIVPRADLTGLTDAQRGVFVDVATEVFNYAGCQDTLAKCLAAAQTDPHALRMAALVKQFASEGFAAPQIIQAVEAYYASFEPSQRTAVKAENCPILGKGPVTLVEFSDYQCPHCAAAVAPLDELVSRTRKGQVRLCSKYFPFPSHPRARLAAACSEYARTKGKFWEMNAILFEHQDALEDEDLKRYAKQVGLNGDEMLKQVYSGKFDDAVEKNIREGAAAGVESTPALFIDGRLNGLPIRPWYLAFTVDDELQWQKEKGWKFSAAPQGRAQGR
ncbi:MAG TPA: DsbA family protein [Myxococcales bacterium]|nr:DsbA family protein [Myxococcales bacterium]